MQCASTPSTFTPATAACIDLCWFWMFWGKILFEESITIGKKKKITEVILEWSRDLVRLLNMTPSVFHDFSSYHPGFKICAGAV